MNENNQAAERARCTRIARGAADIPGDGGDFHQGWTSAALQIAQAINMAGESPKVDLAAREPTGEPNKTIEGLRAALHELERERDYYRERCKLMHEHQAGQVWYWQNDGHDNLHSLVNSLPVVIRADQLRALIAPPCKLPDPVAHISADGAVRFYGLALMGGGNVFSENQMRQALKGPK